MKVKCKNCGKEFNIKPSALARGWGKYCSVACRSESVKNTINHNTLDNRKRNLRICTASENNSNRSPLKNSKSGHVGVCWRENEKAWRVHYMGKEIAYTKSLEEAIKIRKSTEAPKLSSFILRGGFNGKSSF